MAPCRPEESLNLRPHHHHLATILGMNEWINESIDQTEIIGVVDWSINLKWITQTQIFGFGYDYDTIVNITITLK